MSHTYVYACTHRIHTHTYTCVYIYTLIYICGGIATDYVTLNKFLYSGSLC